MNIEIKMLLDLISARNDITDLSMLYAASEGLKIALFEFEQAIGKVKRDIKDGALIGERGIYIVENNKIYDATDYIISNDNEDGMTEEEAEEDVLMQWGHVKFGIHGGDVSELEIK